MTEPTRITVELPEPTGRDRDGDPHWDVPGTQGATAARQIIPTADVVLTADSPSGTRCVLLIQRRKPPFARLWALPGGHVDPEDFTPQHAAARELQEETGVPLDAGQLRFVGVFDTPGRDPRGRYVTRAYHAHLVRMRPPVPADDAVDARWWPLHYLPELAFDHAAIIARALDLTGRTR